MGEGHPKHIAVLSSLGWAYAAIGNFDACTHALQECVRFKLASDGESGSGYADALVHVGRAYKIAGKLPLAVDAFEKACAAFVRGGLTSTVQYLEAREGLADALAASGKQSDASTILSECEALRKQLLPNTPTSRVATMMRK